MDSAAVVARRPADGANIRDVIGRRTVYGAADDDGEMSSILGVQVSEFDERRPDEVYD